jgi:hypothetical protein
MHVQMVIPASHAGYPIESGPSFIALRSDPSPAYLFLYDGYWFSHFTQMQLDFLLVLYDAGPVTVGGIDINILGDE